MPTFRTSPPELVERFGELAALVPDATQRPMFGYPSCVVGGNMFMALHEDALVLRLADPDREEFRERYDAPLFEPMPGRPMREYVVVPSSLVAGEGVEEWVERSYAYARQLPAKPAKQPAKKPAKKPVRP